MTPAALQPAPPAHTPDKLCAKAKALAAKAKAAAKAAAAKAAAVAEKGNKPLAKSKAKAKAKGKAKSKSGKHDNQAKTPTVAGIKKQSVNVIRHYQNAMAKAPRMGSPNEFSVRGHGGLWCKTSGTITRTPLPSPKANSELISMRSLPG